ncbi:bifunctional D-glycero-beta-D-manno-heptose-7-phosphate kinase/D-glycero-beta-D-manno-heptose 1-phosphate adenylyltransferase HldE [Candidatus Berkiella aquae]|uniref:Bifunctional protein HldE n=1 Tax=Candidatus Berkiella aquae TaxID=295108 RepID=A0A0Q9Y9Z0_9GAMM|nr:bifunctional D-glycero-beta-D-manno-heptose-7-phosphate kinase/D-glycero-beta-D-manno-heptose 1-phosphate adenylyltransferase HldE [Candidatus Berkiella aquae]MCS5710138.1 bifunctional D-glycero-beta-D-manno-heptose-7-phosphate kinase/D-glycero-beta-D-manno-heptose 1-phosphate adenylyltransferase HldE [Candidatus Berkiella aquae]
MLNCPDFSSCNVVVIGDAMLDRYWHGDTSRISPEAPVPVVRIDRHEERVGGAANVAVNVTALGGKTTLISVIGEDDPGRQLFRMLQSKNVQCDFIRSPTLNTTLKLRVLGRHQQLIRLDFEDKVLWPAEKIIERFAPLAAKTDVLILSDYAKGVLAYPQAIIEYARKNGVKVIVDPKNADLSIYRGANILTPNMSEFEMAVGACHNEADIVRKGLELVNHLALDALLVTRGSQGMTLLEKNGNIKHIPTKAREVFDITGAGDTVIAVLASAIAAKCSFVDAAELANIAAGISVGRLGTATITSDEIKHELDIAKGYASSVNILSQQSLLAEVDKLKLKRKKIVMTNGCFDILHAGHITYLQQARALGDCLIMAVNDDASIKRLKGPTRPVNPLAERMQVLAALGCVDFVVPFSEDTPAALIEAVTPHILVKGGDYEVHQIAGASHVLAHGGQVKILPFVPGCSTTGMLERINQTAVELEVS